MLETLRRFVQERGINLYDLCVIENGTVHTAACTPSNPLNNSYSVTKLFITTAVGMLCDRGILSPDTPLMRYLAPLCPDYDARWDAVTVHHALSHAMGLTCGVLDVDRDDARTYGPDHLAHVLACPPEEQPGFRLYTDVPHYLLSRVIAEAAGERAEDFIEANILQPLGCGPVAFQRCPQGHMIGASGGFMTAEDMARLGWLYLHEGRWQGRQILSKDWVRRAEREAYDLYPVEGAPGWMGKGGLYGQMVLYHREKGLVIAWHGYEPHGGTDALFPFIASLR